MLTQKNKIMKNVISNNVIVKSFVSLYVSWVLYLSVFDNISYIAFFPMFFMGSYWCLCIMEAKGNFPALEYMEKEKNNPIPISFVIILFGIIISGQLLYWMAYYPGGFNLDAYGQWDQVHGLQRLNNWHPVFTTACYWIITRIYDSFALCIFVQLCFFSVSATYLLTMVYRVNKSKIFIIFSAIYISINPAIGMDNVCLFKDVPFAIALIWLSIYLIKIVFSCGKWLESWIHVICLVVDLVVITLIRHNGIFIVIPLILCLIFLYKQYLQHSFVVSCLYIMCCAIIQGPIFSAYLIEEHSNTIGESVGIPMAIMANCLISDEENVPEDVKEFLLTIAPEEEWREKYFLGEWDSCKWDFGGIELFQEESVEKILHLTTASIIASPNAAYQSIRENTRVVWQILGGIEWDTWVYIEENDYGIKECPNDVCYEVTSLILKFSKTLVGGMLCWNIGLPNIIFVIMLWYVINRREQEKVILIVPIVSYNLLTMLLLCGPSHRYFYFNSILVLPILLCLLTSTHDSVATKVG